MLEAGSAGAQDTAGSPAVAAAGPGSPEHLGDVAAESIALSAPLALGSTYAWRVDAEGLGGTAKGAVWTFNAAPIAVSPNAVSLAAVRGGPPIDLELALSAGEAPVAWTAGAGDNLSAEINVIGCTVEEASQRVGRYIEDAVLGGLTRVRIIHGKGRGSGPRGPVLKKSVNLWLRKHDAVLAFCSARAPHGGTGAIYVLLRS